MNNKLMKTIISKGSAAAGGLLPAYSVTLNVLEENDVIELGDMVLVGSAEYNYHGWVSIVSGSPMIGTTPKEWGYTHFARKQ